MTKGEKVKLSLDNFVKNTSEAILARTHLMREWTLVWVFVPLLYITTLTCLTLFVLDALGLIRPMRDSLPAVTKIVLGTGVGGSAIGAGVRMAFRSKVFKLGQYRHPMTTLDTQIACRLRKRDLRHAAFPL